MNITLAATGGGDGGIAISINQERQSVWCPLSLRACEPRENINYCTVYLGLRIGARMFDLFS